MYDPLILEDLVTDELEDRRVTGHDVGEVERVVERARRNGSREGLLRALEQVEATVRTADWPYQEPSDLAGIRRLLPAGPSVVPFDGDDDALLDRVHAAWLGRCAGCNLGKPIEGWVDHHLIRSYLEQAGAYPLEHYIPVLDPMPEGLAFHGSWRESTRGNVTSMARDDDTDYTILGLHILETYGLGFTPAQVAEQWLDRIPITQTYTAERAAYRNLVIGLAPPATATFRNPYREWIGAQIRADIFGYVAPGRPDLAAALAYRDAAVSHVGNGIYGELWAAALVAAAFVAGHMRAALAVSIAQIPASSRLAEALREVLDLHAQGLDWDTARERIDQRHGHYSWVHTINNACLVAAALLWGEGDFTRTIGLAVQGGWDTDCNGATAGSAFGAMHGTEALPGHWVDPLQDRIASAIAGFDNARISDLARRTSTLALKARNT